MDHAGVLWVNQTQALGLDHGAITPRHAHRTTASLVDQTHDGLLHLAAQDPLDHRHGLGIGHPHALNELTLLTQTLQQLLDLWTSPVHHHRAYACELQHHHVFGKRLLQGGIGHGVATVLDDHGFAMAAAQSGQGTGQGVGPVLSGDGGSGGRFGHGGATSVKAEGMEKL